MTSLADKMGSLVAPINPLFPERCKGFNQGVAAAVALAKAEAASPPITTGSANLGVIPGYKEVNGIEAAVVRDWEVKYRLKRHNDSSSLIGLDETIDSEIDFIKTLLAAKDGEREEKQRDAIARVFVMNHPCKIGKSDDFKMGAYEAMETLADLLIPPTK